MKKKQIVLCAICNVQSGQCPQDCGYCAQSARYDTGVSSWKEKNVETVVAEAKRAKKSGALGFCLVTSGVGLDDKKLQTISRLAQAVKTNVEGLMLIACNGIATVKQLRELKRCGIDSYNHNLETSESFFGSVCTTHSWQQRYKTCENVKEAELMLCSGGIFGLGESQKQREELLLSLQKLQPMSTPINFYHPTDKLPIREQMMSADEALSIIRAAKTALPNSMIMVAGGREITLKDRQHEMFEAGCDSIVVGDYLTKEGQNPGTDRQIIEEAGCEVALTCEH